MGSRWVAISISTFGKCHEFNNLVHISFDFNQLEDGVRLVLSSCSLFVAETPNLVYLFNNLVVCDLRDIVLTTLACL